MCRVGYVPSLLCAELSHNQFKDFFFVLFVLVRKSVTQFNNWKKSQAPDA